MKNMRGNKGVSMITVVVLIIVMIIIASVGIIQGNKVVIEAKAHKKQANLIAVETAIGRVKTSLDMAEGNVIPNDVKLVGIKDPVIDEVENIVAEGWYLLDESALAELGIEKDKEAYLVNYLTGKVLIVSDGINIEDFKPTEQIEIYVTATATTHSITAIGHVSGPIARVVNCYFRLDDGEWVEVVSLDNLSYIFDDLNQNTEHEISMRVIDVDTYVIEAESTFMITNQIPNEGIDIYLNPSEWTNTNVSVTIGWPSGIDDLIKQYSLNGTSWSIYTSTVPITNNCTIYARLNDVKGQTGAVISKQINYIDRVMPTSLAPTATTTTNSISVTVNQTDSTSGINQSLTRYAIKKSTETNFGGWQVGNTFANLVKDTSYNVKTRVTDNAGNVQESSVLTISTLSTSSNISFALSNTNWTNSNIVVTVIWPDNITGLTKQYSLDGSNYSTYTNSVTVTNNLTMYARLINGSNQVVNSANINITNIDKTLPTMTAPTTTSDTNSVTVTLEQTDLNSGIDIGKTAYAIKPLGGTYSSWQSSNVFTGLSTYTTYVVISRVTDKAGNTVESLEDTVLTVCSHPSFTYSNYSLSEHKKVCALCGEYTNQAHSYGSWFSYDDSQHRRKCSKCSRYDYAYHDYDLSEMDGQYYIYRCNICGKIYRTLVAL
jgi:hypothetical protein